MSSEPVVPIDRGLSDSEIERLTKRANLAGEPSVASDVRVHPPEFAQSTRKREAAETVGAVVGKAVVRMRELPRHLADMRARFTVIRERTRRDATLTAQEPRQNAQQRVWEARTRADHLAHECPVQFILGAGAAAFVVGFALRVWRSSRRA